MGKFLGQVIFKVHLVSNHLAMDTSDNPALTSFADVIRSLFTKQKTDGHLVVIS